MKKILILTIVLFAAFSCIKKDALKYDPELVGTWVSNSDNVNTWLIIQPDGIGNYSTKGNDEGDVSGEVKYSLFERKMWVGSKKFKVTVWRSGKVDGVDSLKTKSKATLKDTTYKVDEKMILKNTEAFARRTITFYRVAK
jgi:hypothetical protein